MSKIKLKDLIGILSSDVIRNHSCIEMNFCIENDDEYKNCWLGKKPHNDDSNKEVYWYGLVKDGSQAYSYENLEDILNSEVFHSKSLCDVIEKITWYSLDGCGIEEMLPNYINDYEQNCNK